VFYLRPRRTAATAHRQAEVRLHESNGRSTLPCAWPPPSVIRDLLAAGFARNMPGAYPPLRTTASHFVVSFTLRALLHFLEFCAPKGSMPSWKFRQLCGPDLAPSRNLGAGICAWYEESRLHKARLAP